MSENNEKRLIQLNSGALSGKQMVALSLSGTEAISELYSFVVELSAEKDDIDADAILGEETGILLKALYKEGKDRYVHGRVSEFTNMGMDAGGDARYQAVIVPQLWFSGLAEKIKSHSYEQMKLQEIYKALLDETGVKYKVLANDNAAALNYFQIQYNESDLDFILRFLSEAGISFFFEHSASEHKMVLVNSASMYTKKPEKLRYSASGVGYSGSETVLGWRKQYQCFAPKAVHKDYQNKSQEDISGDDKANTKIRQIKSIEASFYGQGFANMDPGSSGMPSLDPQHATAQAKTSVRREQGKYFRIGTSSDCASLNAGVSISLKDKPPGGGTDFIITRIHHSATSGLEGGTDYSNNFECIPNDAEIVPDIRERQPVYGSLAARVVQSDYDDTSPERKYGLVKVAFPWDEDSHTPWLQVAQIFGSGGGDSGAWFLPQLDDDVLVSFLGGDTRRPVVVGIMHNGKDDGPNFTNGDGEFTRIGIRTPEGSELSFADKGGKKEAKEVYLESVGNFDRLVAKNETVKVEKDNEIDITGNQKIDVGQKITIEAGTSIELKVGSNKITIDSSGVKIEGMNVEAKAKMEAKIEGLNVTATAKVNAKVDGAMSELSGKAMTTVKGGMVMIN